MTTQDRRSIEAYRKALKVADADFAERLLRIGLTEAATKRVLAAARSWSARRANCSASMTETQHQLALLDDAPAFGIEPPPIVEEFIQKRRDYRRRARHNASPVIVSRRILRVGLIKKT